MVLSTVLITHYLACETRRLQKGQKLHVELSRYFHVCMTASCSLRHLWLHARVVVACANVALFLNN